MTVKAEELQQIQGVGKAKADVIAKALAGSDDPTVEQLTEIKGVSERIATQVIKVAKGEAPAKPKPRKRAKKTTAAKTTVKRTTTKSPSSNGHSITLDAGTLRRLARVLSESDVKADQEEATRIQHTVADLMDDEPVPMQRFA